MYKIGIIEDLDDSFNDYKEIFEDDEIFEEGLITNPNQLYEKK